MRLSNSSLSLFVVVVDFVSEVFGELLLLFVREEV